MYKKSARFQLENWDAQARLGLQPSQLSSENFSSNSSLQISFSHKIISYVQMALSQGLSLSNSVSSLAWMKETLKSRNISFIVARSTDFWKWSEPTAINAAR